MGRQQLFGMTHECERKTSLKPKCQSFVKRIAEVDPDGGGVGIGGCWGGGVVKAILPKFLRPPK